MTRPFVPRSATRLTRGPAPGAENQAADCKVHEWPAHVDQMSGHWFVSKEENTAMVACSTKRKANQQSIATFKPAIALWHSRERSATPAHN